MRRGTFTFGERTVRPLPRGCLHVERTTNEDRSKDREERKIFLGAGRSTCRRQAVANRPPVLTLQSCLVQPKLAATGRRTKAAQTKGRRQSLRRYRETKKKFVRISRCAY